MERAPQSVRSHPQEDGQLSFWTLRTPTLHGPWRPWPRSASTGTQGRYRLGCRCRQCRCCPSTPHSSCTGWLDEGDAWKCRLCSWYPRITPSTSRKWEFRNWGLCNVLHKACTYWGAGHNASTLTRGRRPLQSPLSWVSQQTCRAPPVACLSWPGVASALVRRRPPTSFSSRRH